MDSLFNKHILLGVTGGISAYKSADLVRRLRDAGAEVRVVMTRAATGFVTPLTFQALSGHPVHTELMDVDAEKAMGHIELARWADAVLVAPATADFIARLTHGRADDLLSTICVATTAPIAVAPAMNHAMWANAATVENVEILRRRQVAVLGPAVGSQACGEIGPGRMLEPGVLVRELGKLFTTGALAGLNVVVTAGPTREPLDPVRYLSNRSSGKMGYAVARACAEAGARVTLISGPVALDVPPGLARMIRVETAQDMFDAVMSVIEPSDMFIGVAAVADYRPQTVSPGKIKKSASTMNLSMLSNPDIIAAVAGLPVRPFLVGFAAETDNIGDYARAKLRTKGLDMIAANRVGDGMGFETDDNALEVIWETGETTLARTDKNKLARQLVELVARRYRKRSETQVEETTGHVQGTTENT